LKKILRKEDETERKASFAVQKFQFGAKNKETAG